MLLRIQIEPRRDSKFLTVNENEGKKLCTSYISVSCQNGAKVAYNDRFCITFVNELSKLGIFLNTLSYFFIDSSEYPSEI